MPHRLSTLLTLLTLTCLAACQQTSQPTSVPPAASTVPAAIAGAATSIGAPALSVTPDSSRSPSVQCGPRPIPAVTSFWKTLSPGSGYNRYIASYQSDGLKLFGLLTVPTGSKPAAGWPVILLNHGYIPPDEYSTDQSYKRIVAPLAEAGYIVFKPDYRGNGTSPGMPSQPYIAPDYVTDSLNALASIKKYKDADPDRIGVGATRWVAISRSMSWCSPAISKPLCSWPASSAPMAIFWTGGRPASQPACSPRRTICKPTSSSNKWSRYTGRPNQPRFLERHRSNHLHLRCAGARADPGRHCR